MVAGILNEIISTLQPHIIRNEYGEEITEWKPGVEKTRANVTYTSEDRRVEAGINETVFPAVVVFKVRIYNQRRVKELDRIVWRGEQYQILSIEVDRVIQQLVIKTSKVNE